MTTIIKHITRTALLAGIFCIVLGSSGCRINYSLRGGTLSREAKTVSIPFIPNSSSYVSPTLSASLTDALRDRLSTRTKLELIAEPEDADLSFVAEITGTTIRATTITAGNNFPAAYMRLTVTVKVKHKNKFQPENDFERSFSQYSDFPSEQTLESVETEQLEVIIKALVDDIYNAAMQNW